jgi:hypothetical protein
MTNNYLQNHNFFHNMQNRNSKEHKGKLVVSSKYK